MKQSSLEKANRLAEKVFGKPTKDPEKIAQAERIKKSLGCGCLIILAIFFTLLGVIGNCNFLS